MPSFPNRCQHLKVNGTQCGCPALRRNRFCYFHKRHHEERIQLNLDRLKNPRRCRAAIIELPVLEDANSIQVSLMQIMRLLVSGQLDAKIAGLLLYALQTASLNLSRTTFEPYKHTVVLDPATVRDTPLDAHIWEDEDFETEEDEEEEMRAAALERARRKARREAELDAEVERLIHEGDPKLAAERARERASELAIQQTRKNDQLLEQKKLAEPGEQPPARERGAHSTIQAVAEDFPPAALISHAGRAIIPTARPRHNGRRPAPHVDINELRKQVRAQIREALPAIMAVLREQKKDSGRDDNFPSRGAKTNYGSRTVVEPG